MPSSGSKKTNRIARCAYVEQGRRCVRNAVPGTNPALCNVHMVVFQDMGRPPPQRSAVNDVLEDLLAGERPTKDQLYQAADEIFGSWGMGGHMASGYHPDIEDDGSTAHEGRSRFRPPDGFRFPPGWPPFFGSRGPAREPEPDPEAEIRQQQAAAFERARQVLGFATSQPLTRDVVRIRHRELAKRHHPDRGGKLEKMQEINAAVDTLMESLPP